LPSSELKKVHLVGVGGCGMSGVAKMLLATGVEVTGCDTKRSESTQRLEDLGATIYAGHDASHVGDDVDLVVHSAAVKGDTEELEEAARRNIPVLKYAQMVGRLMREKTGIAVSGTHGKTTTSAMISFILHQAKVSPSFVVGATIAGLNESSMVGRGPYFVVEACEYDRSFHNFRPHIAVTTNIEPDHLDYYRGMPDLVDAFSDFAALVDEDGLYVVSADSPPSLKAARAARARVETFGIGIAADWEARNLQLTNGSYAFEVAHNGETFGDFQVRVPGRHNVSNALAAIAVTHAIGLEADVIGEHLLGYRGTARRFEVLGEAGDITIIDDYAHHPTEVRATLSAARELFGGRRLIVVFQPHQYSRTRFLLSDFAASFDAADILIVPDIYFVRDSEFERSQINAGDLVFQITRRDVRALYIPHFDEIIDYLDRLLEPNDVLITMGAGNVNEIANNVLARFRAAVR